MSSPLPYGCRRGYKLCPTAIALWDAANTAYEKAEQTQDDVVWAAYDEAMKKYDQHFTSQEVQDVLL